MDEKDQDNRPYRRSVGMMVINESYQIFVARRVDFPEGAWQMPQGGINDGENPCDAALRELYEETAIQDVEVIAESSTWRAYDLPVELSKKIWNGEFKGQTQKWFLLKFLGHDRTIKLDAHHPEFCEWCWVSLKELPDLAIYFKRKSYLDITKEFKKHFE